ncbi:MAG TPA: hypothetical protein VFU49_13060 [Ktedonobacteraceae bacterium]|nr:hypothetical protein [Ktedonobacteraceae bacterium]
MLHRTFYANLAHRPEYLLQKQYFFHDISIRCQVNHPALLRISDALLSSYPGCDRPRGEARYDIFCSDKQAPFAVALPPSRIRMGKTQLLTGTQLKYYHSAEDSTEYQRYAALPGVNAEALSVIDVAQHYALTQLEKLEYYEPAFLYRYVLLLALGRLMHPYGFEPCHAAAIHSPWDQQQGALILGSSGSGKTTLSLGCAIAGCGLLGDDLVMLRYEPAQATVRAYSIMPEISVRSASLALWEELSFLQTYPVDARDKRYCPIEQIRQGAASTEVPIRVLIFPQLITGTRSTLQALSKAQTLQALIEECISKENIYPEEEMQLFSLLSVLTEQAPGYRLNIARGSTDGPELVCSLFKR